MSHAIGFARYLTLVWPGMPWLWLRGSVAGLALALAFALAVDVAVFTTWIWSELVDFRLTLALWTATAAIWLISTISAITGFPPPIPRGRDAAVDALFLKARDAYLARDWLAAETKLRALLDLSPTDGEGQLLLGTLLRRVGRLDEAVAALTALSRGDTGAVWRVTISRELERIEAARRGDGAAAPPQAVSPTDSQADAEADGRADPPAVQGLPGNRHAADPSRVSDTVHRDKAA